MDNATGHERKVMVWLDICMGLALIFWAAVFKVVKYNYENDPTKLQNNVEFFEEILHLATYLNYIIAGALTIILMVQVMNWFSKKNIAYVLSVFVWS
jgi:hypothetical protein